MCSFGNESCSLAYKRETFYTEGDNKERMATGRNDVSTCH